MRLDIVLQLVAFLKHLLKVLLMLRHAAVELLLRDVHIFYLDVEILSGTQRILLVLVTKGTVPLVSRSTWLNPPSTMPISTMHI